MDEEKTISKVAMLYTIDEGKFNKLMEVCEPKDECFKCSYFNHMLPNIPENQQECRRIPTCMAMTLRSELISYLLFKTGVKSYSEHEQYIGM